MIDRPLASVRSTADHSPLRSLKLQTPSDEQAQAVDAFSQGHHLGLQIGAGTLLLSTH